MKRMRLKQKKSKIPVPPILRRPHSTSPASSRRGRGGKASSTQQTLVSMTSQTSDYYSETDVSSSSSSSSKCGGVEEWRQHKLSPSQGIVEMRKTKQCFNWLHAIK